MVELFLSRWALFTILERKIHLGDVPNTSSSDANNSSISVEFNKNEFEPVRFGVKT